MYEILFYRDQNDIEPVKEYLLSLAQNESKDSRIKLNKIRDYVKLLSDLGTSVGKPYVKHLDGEIWELRPIRDRILFARLMDGRFVLLHQFMKKTQKTPKREIQTAQQRLSELKERLKNE